MKLWDIEEFKKTHPSIYLGIIDIITVLSYKYSCGEEQRKFLDEIEKAELNDETIKSRKPGMNWVLCHTTFDCDMEKVIRGE
jgi:hypothetical protein